MDRNALILAGAIGFTAQLAMIVTAHLIAPLRGEGVVIGGLVAALATGLVYPKLAAATTWPSALLDGGLAAGVSAFLAIGVSVALKDTLPATLIGGTLSSVVAGVIGGGAGKMWR